MSINRVYLVGVGGTGSHLLEPLSKLFVYHPQGCTDITVIDGDEFEAKLLASLNFS